MTDDQIIKPTTPSKNEQTMNTDKQSLEVKEKTRDNAPEEPNTITSTDIKTHDQLTRALHNLDLLNAQLGVAGSLLVGHYHLQKQRESRPVQPPAYPQYQMPPQTYVPTPQPVAPVPVQAPLPPPVPAYQNPQQINPTAGGQTPQYQQPVHQTPVQNQTQTSPPPTPSSS